MRSDVTGGVEAQVLSDSLNTMIDKINELLEQVKTEQIRLRKAEFELLQSQINPHFYIIRWMPLYGWRRRENRKRS